MDYNRNMKKVNEIVDRYNPKKMHRTRKQLVWKKFMLTLWVINFTLIGYLFYLVSKLSGAD